MSDSDTVLWVFIGIAAAIVLVVLGYVIWKSSQPQSLTRSSTDAHPFRPTHENQPIKNLPPRSLYPRSHREEPADPVPSDVSARYPDIESEYRTTQPTSNAKHRAQELESRLARERRHAQLSHPQPVNRQRLVQMQKELDSLKSPEEQTKDRDDFEARIKQATEHPYNVGYVTDHPAHLSFPYFS